MIERNLIDRNADDLRNVLFTYTRYTGNKEQDLIMLLMS